MFKSPPPQDSGYCGKVDSIGGIIIIVITIIIIIIIINT